VLGKEASNEISSPPVGGTLPGTTERTARPAGPPAASEPTGPAEPSKSAEPSKAAEGLDGDPETPDGDQPPAPAESESCVPGSPC
jgi:hypothetical protein